MKWAFGFPNTVTAYSQPTVAGGRVYTGSNDGTVYALDAQSGCIYWMYQAKAMVRDAVVIGPGPRAYFGDLESNFYALDADTGKLVWQKKLDNQPFTRITGTAKLHDGRLYVPIASQEENAGANPQYSCCTFRGNLVVVKASDGSIVWRTYTTPEPKPTRKSAAGVQYYGPSGATIWSSPTLDLKRKLVYVAAGNGYSGPDIKTADAVIAMDMETGKIKWSQQTAPDMFNWGCAGRNGNTGNCPENAGTDVDLGGSPILLDIGGGKQMLVQGQKSAEVHGLDPDQNGKIVWSTRIGIGGAGGGIQWGIAAGDGLVFAGLGEAPRGAQAPPANTGIVRNRSGNRKDRLACTRARAVLRRPARLLGVAEIAAHRNSRRGLLAFDGRTRAGARYQDGEDHLGFRYSARVSHRERNSGQGRIHGGYGRDRSGWHALRELRLFQHARKCAAGFRCKIMRNSLKTPVLALRDRCCVLCGARGEDADLLHDRCGRGQVGVGGISFGRVDAV